MHELLDEKDSAAARVQGWELADAYDQDKQVWEVAVFSLDPGIPPFEALAWVTEQAKKHNPVCAQALKLIAVARINNARKGKPRGSKTNARKPR